MCLGCIYGISNLFQLSHVDCIGVVYTFCYINNLTIQSSTISTNIIGRIASFMTNRNYIFFCSNRTIA